MRRRGYVRFAPPRRGLAVTDAPEDAALVAALPSDTEAALDHLRRLASAQAVSSAQAAWASMAASTQAPLVLQAHLGSVLANPAEVEAAVDTLRASNTVRLLRLPASPEVVLCRTADVRALLEALGDQPPPHCAAVPSTSSGKQPVNLRCFERVLEQCRGASVPTQRLRAALAQPRLLPAGREASGEASSRKRPRALPRAAATSGKGWSALDRCGSGAEATCSGSSEEVDLVIASLERAGFLRARESGGSSEVSVGV